MSNVTQKIIIAAIALLISSSALFGFMVYQVIGEGALLTEQIEALDTERAQEAVYYTMQRLAEESVVEREQLQSYFLDSNGNGIDLLNSVEAMAPEAGVILATESVDLVTDPSDESEWIQATFSFRANRPRVQNFIQILETLPYVSRVMNISLRSSGVGLWDATVVIRVRILDYDK